MPRSSALQLVPTELLMRCADLARDFVPRNWHTLDETDLWEDLATRILSTQVRWEDAQRASNHLRESGLLGACMSGSASKAELKRTIRQLKPGIRWADSKASRIYSAALVLYGSGRRRTLKRLLQEQQTPQEVRHWLSKNIPGIGPKQASHFLQAIGYSSDLAVLDCHVLEFLSGQIPKGSKNYAELEMRFQSLARRLDVNPVVLDYAIWDHMRT